MKQLNWKWTMGAALVTAPITALFSLLIYFAPLLLWSVITGVLFAVMIAKGLILMARNKNR